MPATRNPIPTLVYAEGSPVTSIVPHVVATTTVSVSSLGHLIPLAASKTTVSAIGVAVVMIAVLVCVALLAAVASAARSLAAALAELARLGSVLFSALLLTVLVVVVLLALLIHQ
jgi:hypothetical protein